MSLVGHNSLNRALAESKDLDPAKIIDALSKYAADALNRTSEYNNGRDGMDMALCVYDKQKATLDYAGSFSPLYIFRAGELLTYKPDKIVIGSAEHAKHHFSKQRIKLQDGDMIYVFSDGYVDQFGGDYGRKFMYEPFRAMLKDVANHPAPVQLKMIEANMEQWRGSVGKNQMHDQVDDMLVIGVRHRSQS
jgi:serine phosphatase RsbU (regulator of sigma subunit)